MAMAKGDVHVRVTNFDRDILRIFSMLPLVNNESSLTHSVVLFLILGPLYMLQYYIVTLYMRTFFNKIEEIATSHLR